MSRISDKDTNNLRRVEFQRLNKKLILQESIVHFRVPFTLNQLLLKKNKLKYNFFCYLKFIFYVKKKRL